LLLPEFGSPSGLDLLDHGEETTSGGQGAERAGEGAEPAPTAHHKRNIAANVNWAACYAQLHQQGTYCPLSVPDCIQTGLHTLAHCCLVRELWQHVSMLIVSQAHYPLLYCSTCIYSAGNAYQYFAGLSSMAQINKQWSAQRDRLFDQFVKDARDLVPKLPCCTCEAGASWRENEGESLVIDLVTLYGRKFDVRLPILDCSGCGAARPFAAVELGCFPLNPSSASPTAQKVIVSHSCINIALPLHYMLCLMYLHGSWLFEYC